MTYRRYANVENFKTNIYNHLRSGCFIVTSNFPSLKLPTENQICPYKHSLSFSLAEL